VKKNLPLGKSYLELSAAAGNETAVMLLKELRKCVGCGELDVHHMICPLCRDVRYCDRECQLLHWSCPTHPHKPHCVPQRESEGAGTASDRVEPPAHLDPFAAAAAAGAEAEMAAEATAAAATAALEKGNDLSRAHEYPEVRARYIIKYFALK